MEKDGSSKRSEENLVKKTCRELGITQRELAEKTKFKEQTIRNWSSKGEIPEYGKAFLLTLLELKQHKEIVLSYRNFTENLQKIK